MSAVENIRYEPVKPVLFKAFVRLRRAARSLVRVYLVFDGDRRAVRREKALLSAADNRFDRHRIEQLDKELERLRAILKETDEELAALGPTLKDLCALAEKMFSVRDKAHVLGVSEAHLRRKLYGDESDLDLYVIIFAYHGEYRGKEDFVSSHDLDMPLWAIASAWFSWLLQNNEEFRRMTSEVFDRCFPGVPMYQRVIQPDGSSLLKRLPPKLRIVGQEEQS